MEETARTAQAVGLEAKNEVAYVLCSSEHGGDFHFERFETLKVMSPFLLSPLKNDKPLSAAVFILILLDFSGRY